MNIEKLANDSMIYLSDDEKKSYKKDLEDIISGLEGFKNLDHIVVREDKDQDLSPLRTDLVSDSLSLDQVFLNTDNKKYSYFMIKSSEGEE